jgi:hypothetical protein
MQVMVGMVVLSGQIGYVYLPISPVLRNPEVNTLKIRRDVRRQPRILQSPAPLELICHLRFWTQ